MGVGMGWRCPKFMAKIAQNGNGTKRDVSDFVLPLCRVRAVLSILVSPHGFFATGKIFSHIFSDL